MTIKSSAWHSSHSESQAHLQPDKFVVLHLNALQPFEHAMCHSTLKHTAAYLRFGYKERKYEVLDFTQALRLSMPDEILTQSTKYDC